MGYNNSYNISSQAPDSRPENMSVTKKIEMRRFSGQTRKLLKRCRYLCPEDWEYGGGYDAILGELHVEGKFSAIFWYVGKMEQFLDWIDCGLNLEAEKLFEDGMEEIENRRGWLFWNYSAKAVSFLKGAALLGHPKASELLQCLPHQREARWTAMDQRRYRSMQSYYRFPERKSLIAALCCIISAVLFGWLLYANNLFFVKEDAGADNVAVVMSGFGVMLMFLFGCLVLFMSVWSIVDRSN
jgi:hypothetical protein